MHMPVMDGLEATAKIFELNLNIPIVAMTANVMYNDREIYLKSGLHDCISKPFTSQELWHCLMKYFVPVKIHTVESFREEQREKELRYRLISSFMKENRTKFREVIEAIDSEDLKLACRLVHTLKSNAGHLDKFNLQRAAEDVENWLNDGKKFVTTEQMALLETELNAALAEFGKQLEELSLSCPEEQIEPLDDEQAHDLVEKLETLLESGNPECLNYINKLRSLPDCETLIEQINNFDFENAIVTLANLKKRRSLK